MKQSRRVDWGYFFNNYVGILCFCFLFCLRLTPFYLRGTLDKRPKPRHTEMPQRCSMFMTNCVIEFKRLFEMTKKRFFSSRLVCEIALKL